MIRSNDRLVRLCPGLLAGLIVCLLPAAVDAQTVQFRNETHAAVVVQTATVVRAVLIRDQPCLLRPREHTPKIKANVSKVVTIYDAKTNRVLFRDVLQATKQDLAYGIVFNPRIPGRVRVETRRPAAMIGGKVGSSGKSIKPH
jgi:hypothetical protein